MASRQKAVVVSDVHISNGQKYSWFVSPYSEYFVEMLKKMSNDPGVEELILLGDLFDLWLYPVDVVPWTVKEIIQANPPAVEALKLCLQNIPTVYYMTGNHDAGVTTADLTPLSADGRNLHLITPNWYSEHYGGRRRLEHGHVVDMFNAPDNSGDTIGGYPLGFFITRLAATAENQSAVWHELKKLYQALGLVHSAVEPMAFAHPSITSIFVEVIITLLQKLAGVDDSTLIRFSEPTLDNKYNVGDIKRHYGSLYSTWRQRYPDPNEFLHAMLVGVSPDGLDWYAKKLLSGDAPPKILLMGHTHHSETQTPYDNDGCWCIPSALGHSDDRPSYVEMIGDTATLVPWT
jgi:UDP-2,3-diacylglucosamine pyrophosphatase LpxH